MPTGSASPDAPGGTGAVRRFKESAEDGRGAGASGSTAPAGEIAGTTDVERPGGEYAGIRNCPEAAPHVANTAANTAGRIRVIVMLASPRPFAWLRNGLEPSLIPGLTL